MLDVERENFSLENGVIKSVLLLLCLQHFLESNIFQDGVKLNQSAYQIAVFSN